MPDDKPPLSGFDRFKWLAAGLVLFVVVVALVQSCGAPSGGW